MEDLEEYEDQEDQEGQDVQSECAFCCRSNDNHAFNCPNNNDPFALLVNEGYD